MWRNLTLRTTCRGSLIILNKRLYFEYRSGLMYGRKAYVTQLLFWLLLLLLRKIHHDNVFLYKQSRAMDRREGKGSFDRMRIEAITQWNRHIKNRQILQKFSSTKDGTKEDVQTNSNQNTKYLHNFYSIVRWSDLRTRR